MNQDERILTHFTDLRIEVDHLRSRVAELEAEIQRLTAVIEHRDALERRRRILRGEGM